MEKLFDLLLSLRLEGHGSRNLSKGLGLNVVRALIPDPNNPAPALRKRMMERLGTLLVKGAQRLIDR